MVLARRLTVEISAALAVPAACVAYVGTHLFADQPEQRAALPLMSGGAAAVLLLSAAAYWRMVAPVHRGLAPSAGPEERRRAANAALAAPTRIATLVLAISLATVATIAGIRLWQGRPLDVVVSVVSIGLAFALMAAMLSYSVAGAGLAHATADLNCSVELPGTGSMRTKVALLASGLVAFALLVLGPVAYARYRSSFDRDHVQHAERTFARAAWLATSSGAAAAAEFVWLAAGAPAAVVQADGAIAASAGGGDEGLLASPRGPERERLPAGWRLRHRLGGDRTLVVLIPEATLAAHRGAVLGPSAALGLAVLLASSILVWLVARGLTAPLQLLRQAAERVARGDLTAEPASITRDEIGQLASDFRRMTAGLKGLAQDVQEGSQGVLEGTREMNAIGAEVRAGAAEERSQVSGVQEATFAMQGAVAQAGRGVEGLSGHLAATSGAVGQMTRALEEVRRQAAELARLGEAAGRDVEKLTQVGQRAERQLLALEELAGHSGETLAAVSGSLESLERSTVASQLAAAQAAELADHAGEVVREAASGIEGVRAAVGDAKRRVAALGRRSDDIDQIVTFINDVAGRTNLLSLNASIIATQAGEHGRGFAVVAEQIRELAAQISSSTRSIGEIIRAVRDDVEGTAALIDRGDALAAGGVALAQKSLGALDEIRIATGKGHETAAAIQETLAAHGTATRQVADLVASVAQSSRALAEAVQVVGRSVAGVGSVNRGLNDLADRVAAALEEQSELGRQQLGALDRTNATLREVSGAMERHARAERSVRDALDRLVEAVARREAAAEALGGVADRLGRRSRALAERTARFKVG